MPQGESFWNPYRWVTVSDNPVEHDVPRYHHSMDGISGFLSCELEALTPLLIKDSNGEFVKHPRDHPLGNMPYLPATSLKGAIRTLAEVVGNAAVPFRDIRVDNAHRLGQARRGAQLDIVARMFGHLDGNNVFAGLVRFSDAEISTEPCQPHQWAQYQVAVGQPKPTHHAFYPATNRRKFYHHHEGTKRLTAPHPRITQITSVRPAPPGTRFRFTVEFTNAGAEELNLLIYCLVLEDHATVELGPLALGRSSDQSGVVLRGPLRHKLGGAKPHGAGSSHIRITKLTIRADQAARYRGEESVTVLEEASLANEIDRRTEAFRNRNDRTMQELRAMMIYKADDPRNSFHYPPYEWFRNIGGNAPLKPTI